MGRARGVQLDGGDDSGRAPAGSEGRGWQKRDCRPRTKLAVDTPRPSVSLSFEAKNHLECSPGPSALALKVSITHSPARVCTQGWCVCRAALWAESWQSPPSFVLTHRACQLSARQSGDRKCQAPRQHNCSSAHVNKQIIFKRKAP